MWDRPSLKRELEYTGWFHEMVAELLVTTTLTLPGASGGTGEENDQCVCVCVCVCHSPGNGCSTDLNIIMVLTDAKVSLVIPLKPVVVYTINLSFGGEEYTTICLSNETSVGIGLKGRMLTLSRFPPPRLLENMIEPFR